MKVIVAGAPKTGTKSMNSALTELGYTVYDYLEHYMNHGNEWMKIFDGEDVVNTFKTMYKDVDAVVDAPACFYWREILEAFPDAKVILTTRDEDPWYRSLETQMSLFNAQSKSILVSFAIKFVPHFRHFVKYSQKYEYHLALERKRTLFSLEMFLDRERIVKKYKEHNENVQKELPKDKLLVYRVQEGWEPLCQFLDKDVPDLPFPHRNIGGREVVEQMNNHEFGRRGTTHLVFVLLLCNLVAVILFSSLSFQLFSACIVTIFCLILVLLVIL